MGTQAERLEKFKNLALLQALCADCDRLDQRL